jgi:hypothetical protein
MRHNLIVLIAAAFLAGCGGGGSSSGSQTAATPPQVMDVSSYQALAQDLYYFYFARPADPNSLVNLETALFNASGPTDVQSLKNASATNANLKAIVDNFGNNAESTSLFVKSSPTESVIAIFQILLNRAPSGPELNTWVNAISSGQLNASDTPLAIMAAVTANNAAQGISDNQLIARRTAVAQYFTAQLAAQNKVANYIGNGAFADARNLLSLVTASTDVTVYDLSVRTYVSSMVALPSDIRTYHIVGGVVSGSADGTVTGSFNYDWSTMQITSFIFSTPFGDVNSNNAGNVANVTMSDGATALGFSNNNVSLSLNFISTPVPGDITYFDHAFCSVTNPCASGRTQFANSIVTSKVWVSDEVWISNWVWVPNWQWVTTTEWVSNWTWVEDMECTGFGNDGTCTGYEDDGYYVDSGSYVEQQEYVDQGSYQDDGAYVDTGGYPGDDFTAGRAVLAL